MAVPAVARPQTCYVVDLNDVSGPPFSRRTSLDYYRDRTARIEAGAQCAVFLRKSDYRPFITVYLGSEYAPELEKQWWKKSLKKLRTAGIEMESLLEKLPFTQENWITKEKGLYIYTVQESHYCGYRASATHHFVGFIYLHKLYTSTKALGLDPEASIAGTFWHEWSHDFIVRGELKERVALRLGRVGRFPSKEKIAALTGQIEDLHESRKTRELSELADEVTGAVTASLGPVWASFRDGTYEEPWGGHPWSNTKELFASASTILYIYPDQWAARVAQMTDEDARRARSIAKATLHIFASACGHEKVDQVFSRALAYL